MQLMININAVDDKQIIVKDISMQLMINKLL